MNPRKVPVYCVYKNHLQYSPLALGMIISYAKSYRGGLLGEYYDFSTSRHAYSDAADLIAAMDLHGPGIVLFSDYMWTVSCHLDTSRRAKEFSPNCITVHGGPSFPKYPQACLDYFQKYSFLDIGIRGEGEAATAEMLEQLALHRNTSDWMFLEAVPGLTFRDPGSGRVIRTLDRSSSKEIDCFPSPYLSGDFDLDEASHWRAAVLETNRGCPYSCTFCDWGSATQQKIRKFSLDRVFAEIEWIAARGIQVLWVADANFGIFDRDVEIAQAVAAAKLRYGAPRQVATNYAKNGNERLAVIIETFQKAGIAAPGIISIQTQDQQVLSNVHRSNIKTKYYEELIKVFRKQRLPISTDLMIGLPGATVESLRNDLQFFFDRRVKCKAYLTMVLPNSPMADPEYMKLFQIKTGEGPYITSTDSFSLVDRLEMQSLFKFYDALVGYSVLKYFLYHLQMEHGIPGITFIHELIKLASWQPERLPETIKLLGEFLPATIGDHFNDQLDRMVSSSWPDFYREILEFTHTTYGLAPNSALETIVAAQESLIPWPGREVPIERDLEHDIVSYFNQIRNAVNVEDLVAEGRLQPLASFPPERFRVTDPSDICTLLWHGMKNYSTHNVHWELTSGLLEDESSVYFSTASPHGKPIYRSVALGERAARA